MSAREKRRDYTPRNAQQVPACFAMIPCEVLYDRLSDGAIKHYAVIARYASTKPGPEAGWTPPVPQRQLAADHGCSQKQAYLYEVELREHGHLLKEDTPGRWSRYVLPWMAVHINRGQAVDGETTAVTHDRGTAVMGDRGQGATAVMGDCANREPLYESQIREPALTVRAVNQWGVVDKKRRWAG